MDGGRGVRFDLFIQSFSQLNEKYGDNVAQNILDNTHVWSYLKTSNEASAERIRKEITDHIHHLHGVCQIRLVEEL